MTPLRRRRISTSESEGHRYSSIHIRLSDSERREIQKAAGNVNKTMSLFMVELALQKAKQINRSKD